MRRFILMLACTTALLVLAVPAMAGPFTDVPTDHWAYDAIDKLQAEGFVEGYPDGTFRGNRSFTRYEMAMVVARIWDRLLMELENLELPDGEWVTYDELQDELALIYELMDEFGDELANLGVRMDDVEQRIEAAEGRISNLESFLGSVKVSGSLRNRIEDIITDEIGYAPNDMFEFEQRLDLVFAASPSDYVDVFVRLRHVSSYLDAASSTLTLGINEAWAKADMMKLMGWCPSHFINHFDLVVGRYKTVFGEFGMAFDNRFKARPGILMDLGGDRLQIKAFLARNSYFGEQEGLGIGRVSYGFGDSRSVCGPYDEFARVGFNYLGTGAGNEQGMGVDLDTELLSGVYLNRLRVEYFQLAQDQLGYDVSASYGSDFESSIIAWVDLYNNGNTKISAAYADIGLVPGFSSIDNNPFEEYDAIFPGIGANANWAWESGLNPFPCDFVGGGMRLEHTWWDVLNTQLTFYDGVNQAEEDYPAVVRLKIRYPLSEASDIALEYIHSGIDALTLAKLRGEFYVRF